MHDFESSDPADDTGALNADQIVTATDRVLLGAVGTRISQRCLARGSAMRLPVPPVPPIQQTVTTSWWRRLIAAAILRRRA
jgi:hypothetical protein